MPDKIRMGILGLGRISTLHLEAYKAKYGMAAELVAICDRNKGRLKEVAAEYNLERTYDDVDAFLGDSNIDAVEILTPHQLHVEHTMKAFESGKHVSLQKVPCLTLSEMDLMINKAKEKGLNFRVFENFRFYEPYQRANRLIDEGIIGKPERVDYHMLSAMKSLSQWEVPLASWKWRISEKGNYKSPTLFDDGYHKHSVIAQLLREPIQSVLAWQGEKRVMGAIKWDLPSVVIYTCKNKAHYATWNTSLHDFFPMQSKYYGCDEYVSIYGEKGAIYIPGCTGSMYESCGVAAPGQAGVHWVDGTGTWHSDLEMNTDWADSFVNCSREFIDALHEGRQPELNPTEARYILQIALATIRSVRNNFQEVKLHDVKDTP